MKNHHPSNAQSTLGFVASLFTLALLGLSLTACGDSGGSGCVDDYDCPDSLICVGERNENGDIIGTGRCETFVCATDEDCAEPGVACEQNVCVPSSSE